MKMSILWHEIERISLSDSGIADRLYAENDIKKTRSLGNESCVSLYVVPVVGLEPTRVISPTDFESVTSANSITPACFVRGDHAQNIIRIFCVFVKGITALALIFPSAYCS